MTITKTLKNNVEAENVVLIKENNTNAEKKPRRSTRLKSDKIFPMETYIYIDDDDDDDDDDDEIPDSKKNPCHVKLPMRKSSFASFSILSDSDDSEFMVDSYVESDKCEKRPSAVNEVVLTSSDTHGCKRAFEEELLARERELKRQAEEAQKERRLLKKKKAEELRLLDIQNRQKQRVEEIRESQKQDKENMNLKEIYRMEFQQKLKKLEMKCHDMASLLRGLGILADKNPYVSPIQVHAAYKRALFRFHPDKASGSDMRQQVEAEEKFKLISRMKHKVCNTPTLR